MIFHRHSQTILCIALLLLAVGGGWLWLHKSLPQAYPDAPDGQFACLSYTPSSSTVTNTPQEVRAQIERDLKQLSARTHCVRTYSVINGLEDVPEIARALNMRVLLGIWIGRSAAANEKELTAAIQLGNANRDVIDAIIVGNEVLLRREQEAPALAAMLKRVHEATQIPVTYADVWDFWLKNPSLQDAASFITIHILPYWEDDPIGIDHAIEHVDSIFRRVQLVFPGKRIYVGETGWPSAGRQREAAVPSLQNEARFTREFIAYATTHGFDYNFIEAYDQPWKRRLEGTVGGYWGLYDAQGHEKFPLVGAVIEDARAWRGPLGGLIVAFFMVAIAWPLRLAQQPLHWASLVLGGFALGALLLLQWEYASLANRNWREWLALGAWAFCADVAFVLALFGALKPAFIEQSFNGKALKWLHMALLFGVAYINMGLVFDARYRDFPNAFLVAPAVVLLILHRTRQVSTACLTSIEAAFCTTWLVLSAIIIGINEHLTNGDAWRWCLLCILLALASFPIEAQQQQTAGQQA